VSPRYCKRELRALCKRVMGVGSLSGGPFAPTRSKAKLRENEFASSPRAIGGLNRDDRHACAKPAKSAAQFDCCVRQGDEVVHIVKPYSGSGPRDAGFVRRQPPCLGPPNSGFGGTEPSPTVVPSLSRRGP